MENLEHHAVCPECGVVESVEHIMLECQIPAADEVWRAARQIWEGAGETWPSMSFGIVLGCGLTRLTKKTALAKGRNRLFSKLISEGALLIWKLRNERRIQKEDDESRYHSESPQPEMRASIAAREQYTLKKKCRFATDGPEMCKLGRWHLKELG